MLQRSLSAYASLLLMLADLMLPINVEFGRKVKSYLQVELDLYFLFLILHENVFSGNLIRSLAC